MGFYARFADTITKERKEIKLMTDTWEETLAESLSFIAFDARRNHSSLILLSITFEP